MPNWRDKSILVPRNRRRPSLACASSHCSHFATLALGSLSLSLAQSLSQARQPNVCHHIVVAFSWLLFGSGPIHNSSCIHQPSMPTALLSIQVGRSVGRSVGRFGSLMYLVYSIHFSPSVIMCVTWFSSGGRPAWPRTASSS